MSKFNQFCPKKFLLGPAPTALTRGDQQPEQEWNRSFAFFYETGVDPESSFCR